MMKTLQIKTLNISHISACFITLAMMIILSGCGGGSKSVLINPNIPTITSFSPTSGPPGTVITLTGTHFIGITTIKFNGTAAAINSVTGLTDTSLNVTVPVGATTGKISANTSDGTATSTTDFVVSAPASPVFISFTPTNGAIGTVVTINGTNLAGINAIKFNGTAVAINNITDITATSVKATVPAGATTGKISLTTHNGTATSSTDFTVTTTPTPEPTITSFTPTSGAVGTIVTITGTNLSDVKSVKFNNTETTVIQNKTATSLKVTTPSGASSGKITVSTLNKTATSTNNYIIDNTGFLRKNLIDDADMVWVPDGTFTMGSLNNIGSINDYEFPAHTVTITGYWIYKYEVTVAQYRVFCSINGRELPPLPDTFIWATGQGWTHPDMQKLPMINITWYDAKAYANWIEGSLPTEAQWEYAARGPNGLNYPWGGIATITDWYNGWDKTKCANSTYAPVGSFPEGSSWCNAQDLAGNAWEWCEDWFGNYSSLPVINPTGPITGNYKVKRGGSWHNSVGDYTGCRSVYRSGYNTGLNDRLDNDGFRCVVVAPGP